MLLSMPFRTSLLISASASTQTHHLQPYQPVKLCPSRCWLRAWVG